MPATRFEITLRRPLADGRAFGAVGPYEELKGRLHFSVDPTHASNRAITDLERAPRNTQGRVEFSADVSMLSRSVAFIWPLPHAVRRPSRRLINTWCEPQAHTRYR